MSEQEIRIERQDGVFNLGVVRPGQPNKLDASVTTVTLFIEPGSVWKHYKGNEYKVVAIARLAGAGQSIDDRVVIYRSMEDPDRVFSRPLAEWYDRVDDGYDRAYRFDLVRTAKQERDHEAVLFLAKLEADAEACPPSRPTTFVYDDVATAQTPEEAAKQLAALKTMFPRLKGTVEVNQMPWEPGPHPAEEFMVAQQEPADPK